MPPASGRKYAVAVSFPGERRKEVLAIVEELLPAFVGDRGHIFYDAWHEEEIIGLNSDTKLQAIYRDQCDLVVPFFCAAYEQKNWCGLEWRAIRELIFKRESERVLPFRFDMAEIPGIFSTDICPVIGERSPREIANLIIERHNRLKLAKRTLPVRGPAPIRTGNLREANPNFVGRTDELQRLRDAVFAGNIGVVAAVHGFGGMGKTELAVYFGAQELGHFQGGLWNLNAEGRTELLPLLAELIYDLGLPPSAGPEETAVQRGRRVLAELERRATEAGKRAPNGAACLVVLDNVSEAALLSGPQLDAIPRASWLHVVATTRLGEDVLVAEHKGRLAIVPIDKLDLGDAARLLRELQPSGNWPASTREADAAGAEAIARQLDGFTIAVESVGRYLGLNPDVRPAALLARLRREGLPTADAIARRPEVAAQLRHREKQLGVILDTVLQSCDAAARTALDFAALLPPDSIPWEWLRPFVAQAHPGALDFAEGHPDPWLGICRHVAALRLLVPMERLEIARMHRIIGAHLVHRMGSEVAAARSLALRKFVEDYAMRLQGAWMHSASSQWALAPLQEAVRFWQPDAEGESLGRIAGIVGEIEATIGRLDRAAWFLELAVKTHVEAHRSAPGDEWAARDVSVSLSKLGGFLAKRGQVGDSAKALGYFQRSLQVREELLAANSTSPQAARDVAVSLAQLGEFLATWGQAGDAAKSLGYFQRSLPMFEQLLAANPTSAEAARDVSLSLTQLAEYLVRRGQAGDAAKALSYFQRSLQVDEKLLAANPTSAQTARDVSVSLNKLGHFLAIQGQAGDAAKALDYFERSLQVRQDLLAADPTSTQAARDVSVSLSVVGDFLASRGQAGDAVKALGYFERSLQVDEELLAANPTSGQAARDVSVSLSQLGDFLASRGQAGDAAKALGYFERSLQVDEGRLAANPTSAQAARDVSVSLNKLGDFLARRGHAGDTAKALAYFERSLQVREELLASDLLSAEAARDVSVSLTQFGDFLARRGHAGDAAKALGYFERSLRVTEELLAANPTSAEAARDVAVSLERLAAAKESQLGEKFVQEALEFQQRALVLVLKLFEVHRTSVFYGRTAAVSYYQTARRAYAAGDQKLMRQCLRECHTVLKELIERGAQLDPPMVQLYDHLEKATDNAT